MRSRSTSKLPARREVHAEARIGDTVVAQDGELGQIEFVVRTESKRPVYVVVAVKRALGRRRPVVPWSLVTHVDKDDDEGGRRVHVSGRRRRIRDLPETVPLVI